MSGKLVFVAGLATGYVLGSRAGRARYEQIKKNWLKVWETDAVQEKVGQVEEFAKSRASDVPKVLVAGVKKVSNAINGEKTSGNKPGNGSGTTSSTSTPSTSTPPSSYTPPIPGQTDTSSPSTTN